MFSRPPKETLFKGRYFVSGSGITKVFKDPALVPYLKIVELTDFGKEKHFVE